MSSLPSGRSVGAALFSVGLVLMVWVGMTLIFDLIFHFHPVFLGTAAGWALRRVDGSARGIGPMAAVVLLALLGAIAGTAIIGSADGPLDPAGFTAAIAGLGMAAGVYILQRPQAQRSPDAT